MREIFQQSPFKADFKRVSRSGRYKAEDVLGIIAMLANGKISGIATSSPTLC